MHDQIREHMEIIGADGVHVGTVDGVEGDRIKLTKKDSGGAGFGGGHGQHHHFIPMGLVASVDEVVRLSANADVAVTFEEEEGGEDIADDIEDAEFEDDSGTGETDMGEAPQQVDVNVSDLIDESGRGRA
jgi:hypothetical protein